MPFVCEASALRQSKLVYSDRVTGVRIPSMIGIRLLTEVFTRLLSLSWCHQLPVPFNFQQCEEDVSMGAVPVAIGSQHGADCTPDRTMKDLFHHPPERSACQERQIFVAAFTTVSSFESNGRSHMMSKTVE